MAQVLKFPEKRESDGIEDIYRREFGHVICLHKIYLPNQFCESCAQEAMVELDRYLIGKKVE